MKATDERIANASATEAGTPDREESRQESCEETDIELSIVVPVYNESLNLHHLCERLQTVLDPLAIAYEIVMVNDGSRDDTLQIALECQKRYPAIVAIDLSRNFGKEIAMTAGIDYTRGRAVVPIDADLQDPPELIVAMLDKWREGYDVVCATRNERLGESWMKRFTAAGFYRTISKMSNVPIPANTGDFRLLDRTVVEALKQLPERTRFMKGLFAWVGYRQATIYFDRAPRFAGETTWNYWKLWNFALDGITAFSSLPLKVWSYAGVTVAGLSLIYAILLVIRTIAFGTDVPGYASLMVALLFLGSVQLIAIGVLGEYLGRVYEEVKQRPLYLVRQVYRDPAAPAASPAEPGE
ncbi:MAG: glycosyltransferase family 2 protein [Geitlerinemataceae cyanobacterium]